MAYLCVWVVGSGSWLVGAPPAVHRGYAFPFLVAAAWLVAYLFMVRDCLDDMTWRIFFESFFLISCSGLLGTRVSKDLCRAQVGVYIVHT